jgi:poly(A) polymerase
MDAVLERQAKQLAIPRRFEATIKEIWSLQPRFLQRSGQRPYRLLEHPRYRAGWDFLDLRCRSGELEGDLADLALWWDRFADAAPDQREAMLRPDEAPKKRRRSRGRGRQQHENPQPPDDGGAGSPPAPEG